MVYAVGVVTHTAADVWKRRSSSYGQEHYIILGMVIHCYDWACHLSAWDCPIHDEGALTNPKCFGVNIDVTNIVSQTPIIETKMGSIRKYVNHLSPT